MRLLLILTLLTLAMAPGALAQGSDTSKFFEGHTERIRFVELSADRSRLLTAGDDDVVNIWNTVSGELVRRFEFGGNIYDAHLSPDAAFVLTVARQRVIEWSIELGTPVDTIASFISEVGTAAYNADGTRIAAASQGTIVFYDRSNRTEISRQTVMGGGVNARVERIRYMPDGRRIAWSGYDFLSGAPVAPLPLVAIHEEGDGMRSFAIELTAGKGHVARVDASATHIVATSPNLFGAEIVDIENMRVVFTVRRDTVMGARLFRGGRYLLASVGAAIGVSDVLSGVEHGTRYFPGTAVTALDVSEDGGLMALGRGTRAELWGRVDVGSAVRESEEHDAASLDVVEAGGEILLHLRQPGAGPVEAYVTDILGRRVGEPFEGRLDGGEARLRLSVPTVPATCVVVVDALGTRMTRIVCTSRR